MHSAARPLTCINPQLIDHSPPQVARLSSIGVIGVRKGGANDSATNGHGTRDPAFVRRRSAMKSGDPIPGSPLF